MFARIAARFSALRTHRHCRKAARAARRYALRDVRERG